jgi:hypothetical protein
MFTERFVSVIIASEMDAREQRFREFVENHELFCCHNDFDPVNVREVIATRGIPRSWWRRLKEEFEASEYQRDRRVSLDRSQNGRKGNKIAGRGRPKKPA